MLHARKGGLQILRSLWLQVQLSFGEGESGAGCSDDQLCQALQQHLSIDATTAFATPRIAPASNGGARNADRSAPRPAAPVPSNIRRVLYCSLKSSQATYADGAQHAAYQINQ